jgi:hypothetical protein
MRQSLTKHTRTTAIYGMMHLSQEEAIVKLAKIPHVLPNGQWPRMERPKYAAFRGPSLLSIPMRTTKAPWTKYITCSLDTAHCLGLRQSRKLGSQFAGYRILRYQPPFFGALPSRQGNITLEHGRQVGRLAMLGPRELL